MILFTLTGFLFFGILFGIIIGYYQSTFVAYCIALAQKTIQLEDVIDLREVKNVRLANQLLKLRRKKSMQQQQKMQQENMKAQADAQAQAQQAAAQAETQKQQAIVQSQIQLEQAKAKLKQQTSKKLRHLK